MNTNASPDKSKMATTNPSQSRPAGTTAAAGTADKAGSGSRDDARGKVSEVAETVNQRASEAAEGAKRVVEDGYRQTVDTASAAYDAAADTVDRGYRQARAGVESAARQAEYRTRRAGAEVSRYVSDNPLMVGVIGFAGGLLLGALLPWGRRGSNGSTTDGYRGSDHSQGDHHRSGYGGGHRPYPFDEDRPGDYR